MPERQLRRRFRTETSTMQPNQTPKNQYHRRFKRLVPLGVFIMTLVIFLFVFVKTTYGGGLLSFVGELIGNEQVSAKTNTPSLLAVGALNSQKYPLPSYPVNSNVLAYAQISSTTVPITDGTTLSADIAAANNVSSTADLNTQISIYVVHSGDTISGVAKLFNVSVNTILWANNLNSRSVLQAGQTLVILPVTGITYTVKKGDTIQGIAKKYNADVGDILNYNDLTLSSGLSAGDQVIIPDAELAAPPVPVAKPRLSVGNEPLLDGWGWPAYPGYFVCPVPGARLTQGLHGHNAVDLAISAGTPIHAVAAGTVIIARVNGAWNGGYGNFIVIMHQNGTQSLYAHMSAKSKGVVYAGEQVAQGQTIGYIGSTGMSTGPHTHLEIRGAQNPFADSAACR